MARPMGYGEAEPAGPGKAPSYLGYSALVTLFCCLPFGLVAMVYGVITLTRNNAGDFEGASRASDTAEKWMYAACGAAFLIFVGVVVFRVVGRVTTGH
jgi:TRAP-type C4-dicarboxylate transport system permease small subunit